MSTIHRPVVSLATIIPGLCNGYASRALIRRIERRHWQRRISAPTLDDYLRWLRARGLTPGEIVAVFCADGRWGEWSRTRVAGQPTDDTTIDA